MIFAPVFEISTSWHSLLAQPCSFIQASWGSCGTSLSMCFAGFGIRLNLRP